MKKLIAILFAAVMVLTTVVAAGAMDGAFVPSPALWDTPDISFTPVDGDAKEDPFVYITSYGHRTDLIGEKKKALEEAYGIISITEDLTTLSADLAAIAAEKEIAYTDLGVSDLFDISPKDEGTFKVVLTSPNFSKFVALLKFVDGRFEVVDNASVSGNTLTCTISDDENTAYAVVIEAENAAAINVANLSAETENGAKNNSVLYIALTACLVSAAAVSVVILRKKEND